MATVDAKSPNMESEDVRAEWLARLSELFALLEQWSTELGWDVRQIGVKPMQDSDIGRYEARVILLNKQALEIIVEPIARLSPGTQGIVDLCLMPTYDDIASLLFHDGSWHVYPSISSFEPIEPRQATAAVELSRDTLRTILEAIPQHAA